MNSSTCFQIQIEFILFAVAVYEFPPLVPESPSFLLRYDRCLPFDALEFAYLPLFLPTQSETQKNYNRQIAGGSIPYRNLFRFCFTPIARPHHRKNNILAYFFVNNVLLLLPPTASFFPNFIHMAHGLFLYDSSNFNHPLIDIHEEETPYNH